LLTPGFAQPAAVHRVETKIINKPEDSGLRVQLVVGDRECYPSGASGGTTLLQEAAGEDVVERLDHRTSEMPIALLSMVVFRGCSSMGVACNCHHVPVPSALSGQDR
jgi:hypothetical protein